MFEGWELKLRKAENALTFSTLIFKQYANNLNYENKIIESFNSGNKIITEKNICEAEKVIREAKTIIWDAEMLIREGNSREANWPKRYTDPVASSVQSPEHIFQSPASNTCVQSTAILVCPVELCNKIDCLFWNE